MRYPRHAARDLHRKDGLIGRQFFLRIGRKGQAVRIRPGNVCRRQRIFDSRIPCPVCGPSGTSGRRAERTPAPALQQDGVIFLRFVPAPVAVVVEALADPDDQRRMLAGPSGCSHTRRQHRCRSSDADRTTRSGPETAPYGQAGPGRSSPDPAVQGDGPQGRGAAPVLLDALERVRRSKNWGCSSPCHGGTDADQTERFGCSRCHLPFSGRGTERVIADVGVVPPVGGRSSS